MNGISRRSLLQVAGAAVMTAPIPAWAQGSTAPIKGATITLLGTAGGPPPHVDRSQPANLLTVDGKRYLIDAGENAGQQLMRAGTPPSKVDMTLLTHLHWDHTLGLDYLMAAGWMMGRTVPMPIWGPPGTRELVEKIDASVGIGEAIFRPQVPGRPALASLYPPRDVDVDSSQVLLDDGKVKITAVANSHYEGMKLAHDDGIDKSYSYRFDTAYGVVVFTGDTGPSPAVTALAHGADVLVSEVVDLDSIRAGMVATGVTGQGLATLMDHMEHQHLPPQALGKMAQEAGVKTLVLTHFVTGQHFAAQTLLAPLAATFKGQIILGKDLMTIPLVR
jgi:ribonuclease BN (tRNA processing enzyme)